MTTYSTRTLAEAIIGEDEVEANAKAATRTLRKFLRDELGEGKAVVGKGGRYSLDMNKREVMAMKKKFAAWEIAQAEEKAKREEARNALKSPKVEETVIEDNDDETVIEDDTDERPEGPSDEEILSMLSDDEEIDIED